MGFYQCGGIVEFFEGVFEVGQYDQVIGEGCVEGVDDIGLVVDGVVLQDEGLELGQVGFDGGVLGGEGGDGDLSVLEFGVEGVEGVGCLEVDVCDVCD